MPKVSIIIPVYNAAAFIDECIRSLVSQTLEDCEYIFVNDGSQDNSAAIVQGYAAGDSRIVLIEQHNQGISMARNAGIAAAKGEYLGFCDNDDFLKADMLETLYSIAKTENLDIIVSKTILGRDNKYIIKESIYPVDIVYDNTYAKEHFVADLLKREDLFAVWNKLYRREFIEQFLIRFPANRNIEEDSMFNLQAFNKANRIMFTDYSGYYYRDVVVNESRKYIERDYFQRAVERYRFDYKKEIGLTIDEKKYKRLVALRLMHRVFYLIFRCAVEKGYSWEQRKSYILKMVLNAEIRAVAAAYTHEELEIKGRFQKLIFDIIKGQQLQKMVIVAKGLGIAYSPAVSEILRKINK